MRTKPYSPEQMGRQLNIAGQGLRSISKLKGMLEDQLRILGVDEFMLWMDQHGFLNDLTCHLIDLKKEEK